jgi:hypothetical protein
MQFAVQKLDEAATLVPEKDHPDEHMMIEVIQALCLTQIGGAGTLARYRAASAALKIRAEIETVTAAWKRTETERLSSIAAAENELRKLANWPKSSWALLSPKKPADYRHQAEIYRGSAEQFDKQSRALKDRLDGLCAIYELLARA